jgi:cytochrome c
MKALITAAIAVAAMTTAASAEGDAAAGEKLFKKCKACHTIATPEGEVLFKGGKTGPNLYGVVGRAAGSTDFKYGKALAEAGAAGLVWDEATLAAFVTNPKTFLKDQGTDGKTKMTLKLKKGGEDVAAFLASLNPAPVEEATEEAATN